MTHDEVENLRQAMLTVITNLSDHDIRNLAILEDCYSCPECIKEVCPTRGTSWDEDGSLSCEMAWIKAAEKMLVDIKTRQARNEYVSWVKDMRKEICR